MKDEIKARLIEAIGLSESDAEYVASEIKRWIEDPDKRPSKSTYATDKLIVSGAKDGTLLLAITDSTNVGGIAITHPDPQVTHLHFPDIYVH